MTSPIYLPLEKQLNDLRVLVDACIVDPTDEKIAHIKAELVSARQACTVLPASKELDRLQDRHSIVSAGFQRFLNQSNGTLVTKENTHGDCIQP